MLAAAVDGLNEGASAAGLTPPMVLAVTVLTSDLEAPGSLLQERLGYAGGADCGGVVCAGSDLAEVSLMAPELLTVVPGIRPQGVAADDQGRIATPREAIKQGAGVLVIGRAVTASSEPEEAAASIAAEVAEAI